MKKNTTYISPCAELMSLTVKDICTLSNAGEGDVNGVLFSEWVRES